MSAMRTYPYTPSPEHIWAFEEIMKAHVGGVQDPGRAAARAGRTCERPRCGEFPRRGR